MQLVVFTMLSRMLGLKCLNLASTFALHCIAEVSPEEIASHLEYGDETFIHQYICYNSSSIKLLGPSEESCIAECLFCAVLFRFE